MKTRDYPSALADLGYDVRLIEQKLTTGGGFQVKPDIIVASERYQHLICFDCKGGRSVEHDQIVRYGTLSPSDLARWVRLHNSPTTHNVCLAFRILDSQSHIVSDTMPYPLLILGDSTIEKIRDFSISDLNKAFGSPISLAGFHPPVSYYPFSELDDDVVLLPVVLRRIVELAYNQHRGGPSVLDDATFDIPHIVESIHPYWDALSVEHRNNLSNRVREMMRTVIGSEPDLREHIDVLQSRAGIKVRGSLVQLQRVAQEILERREKQPKLSKFA